VNGPRLVLLHAFPLDCRMWADVRRPLEEAGHVVSAPDLPGPEAEPTLAAWAERVLAAVDGPLIPVGCSMGGYLVFELLRRAPERIAAVGLVSTRAGAETEESRRGRDETIAVLEDDGGSALWERLGPKLFGSGVSDGVVARAREIALEQGATRLAAAVRAIRDREDSTSLLPRVEVPAAVVVGSEDAIVPPAEGEEMARALQRARLDRVDGAGHLVPLERPDVVAGAILELVAAVRAT
jgi:pimeloyl-ACP methyl ester carboxylesterase